MCPQFKTQFNVCFLVNNSSDWIYNIGRGSKMFQFLYDMAKDYWKPVWKQLYVFIIANNTYVTINLPSYLYLDINNMDLCINFSQNFGYGRFF